MRIPAATLLLSLLLVLLASPVSAIQDEHDDALKLEQSVLERINAIRRQHGIEPLRHHQQLAEVARAHSRNMHQRGFFDHLDPQGRQVHDRVVEAGIGYRRVGENIAHNRNAPDPVEAAVRGWLNSPGHRANLLDPRYRATGIGVAGAGRSLYFTQVFLTPD